MRYHGYLHNPISFIIDLGRTLNGPLARSDNEANYQDWRVYINIPVNNFNQSVSFQAAIYYAFLFNFVTLDNQSLKRLQACVGRNLLTFVAIVFT